MDVLDAIKKRRSIRQYLDKPVEEEKVDLVLEAARLAPSAKNVQECRYVIVRDANKRKELAVAAKNQGFLAEAPVIIVCCATNLDYIMTCGQHAYPIDAAIAIDHMTLAAVEQGLGTCWIGAFHHDIVAELIDLPGDMRVVQMLTLGYPAETPDMPLRMPLREVVRNEKWS
jgi:nitroreductase